MVGAAQSFDSNSHLDPNTQLQSHSGQGQFRTALAVNDPAKTLSDMVRSLITIHAANATISAVGLSVMKVQMWKFFRFIVCRILGRLAEPFAREPGG